jgi:F-type H+-transporting ATPase subunit a
MDFVQTLEHHVLDHVFLRLRIGALSLPVSRHAVMLWLSAAVALTGLPLVARSARSGRRTPALAAVEGLVVFVRDDIVLPSIGEEGRKYLSYFLSLFVFILLMNLLGLVPLDALRFLGCPSVSGTATGNVAVTGGLALLTFLLINIAGIRERGLFAYLRGLAPEGLPSWLLPLMYPVEVLGMLTKSFALTIRLFANMIAGHIVMLAFLGLVFMFHKLWIAPLSVAAAVGIVLLDVFVAVLQAYIFTLLSAIFVGGAVHSH